uniref:Variant surface glycoprotein 516 n=1 Tax=Trypanosoma brucei TaxID=5691 RepID=M4TDE3_9TRYP|nr:variant surface glycoprotein 516 [Trypanosoma brucei]
MAKLSLIFALYIATLCVLRTDANIAAGENTPLFRDLCALVALADHQIVESHEAASAISQAQEILQLNMTISEDAWRLMFRKKADGTEWHEEMPARYSNHAEWKALWPAWLKSAKAAKDDESAKAVLKRFGGRELTPQQKKALWKRIQPIAARALAAITTLEELRKAEESEAAKQAQKTIQEAVYGEAKTSAETLTTGGTKLIKGSAKSNTGAACSGSGSTHPASTVVATLLCICSTSSDEQKACVNPSTPLTQWTDGQDGAVSKWDEFKKHCVVNSQATASGPEIPHRLAAIRESLKSSWGSAYLGAFRQTNCEGDQGNGICVQYTGYDAKTPTAFEAVDWVKNLTKTATALEQAEEAKKKSAIIGQQTKQEIEATKAEALIASLETEVQAEKIQPVGSQPPTSSLEKQLKAENECNAAGDDQKKCKDLEGKGCKYDASKTAGQKCTLDEEAKKAAQKAKEETEGKDGKTNTNTTGSNSFAIDRAPLLLAVLLF